MTWRPRVASSNKQGTQRGEVAAGKNDKLLQKIANWIPVEVIAAYNPVMAIIPAQRVWLRFWVSVGMLPVTAGWIAFATGGRKNFAWRQVIIAPFAFACWTAAMQGAMLMKVFPGWEEWMGSLAVVVGTLLLPILDGVLKWLGVPQN